MFSDKLSVTLGWRHRMKDLGGTIAPEQSATLQIRTWTTRDIFLAIRCGQQDWWSAPGMSASVGEPGKTHPAPSDGFRSDGRVFVLKLIRL